MEDERIIALYWDRDEAAVSETDVKYGALLRRISVNILSSREDAEECVSDTYHAAWRAIPPERPLSLRAFLGRITRNVSVSRLRAERAGKRYGGGEILLSELSDCVPSFDNVENTIETSALSALISDWLDGISADDSALFVRRYWYGDGVAELARECGMTPNALSQRLSRLRRSLRATLEAEGTVI